MAVNPPPAASPPADKLLGLTLNKGWVVTTKIPIPPTGTGGNFSFGYLVRKADGEEGFLKALDFFTPLSRPNIDPARALQAMTEAFNFERDVLVACRDLTRVVTAIDDGAAMVDGFIVQYLIFELAQGDVRKVLDTTAKFEPVWALRSLHQIAVGLFQMHRAGVAHQDLKPSNVLMFDAGTSAKLGDLGRAAQMGKPAPHEGNHLPGDPKYAPPEQYYGATHQDWHVRRVGGDCYHLGSMIVFLFTRVTFTALLMSNLDPAYWPGRWGGTYRDLLVYMRPAFEKATSIFEKNVTGVTNEVRGELTLLVRQLCEPDPEYRGHPKTNPSAGTARALERVVSKLHLLAEKTAMQGRGKP